MNIKKLLHGNIRQYGMIIALVFISLFFGVLTNGNIFNAMNVSNLILQNSYIILLSVGMFFCILTGNVDLSVGSVLAFCGAILGVLIVKNGMNPWLAVVAVAVIGIAIGAFQGSFIAFLNVPPFIATLAGELAFRGLTLYILAGHSISPFPAQFQFIASGYIYENLKVGGLNIIALLFGAAAFVALLLNEISKYKDRKKYGFSVAPVPSIIVKYAFIFAVLGFIIYKLAIYRGLPLALLILVVIVLIYNYIATKSVIGRHVMALGGNPKAAALSGVKTKKIMLLVYINSAFMAAISSIIVTARLNAASTSAGTGFELDAIAACYIGGCAASGGEGSLFGVIIGALVMGILNNGMSIMGIGSDIQKVVKGLILLLAVAYDIYSKSNKSKA